jgi:AcrR family transcriptional regulator
MRRGITSKGLATRGRIVAGAAAVLRERGVAATGLDDIRAATGVSSSQLFHYFPGGKPELMLAAAGHEADQILLDQEPYLSGLTSRRSWQLWAAQLLARYEQQGQRCGLSALTSQLDPSDPAVQEIIGTMYQRWHEALATGIRALQASGEAPASLDADQAAAATLAGIQGGVVMMLATGSSAYLKAALAASLEPLRSR